MLKNKIHWGAFFTAMTLVVLVSFSSPAQAGSNEELTIGIAQEFETLNPINAQMRGTTYIQHMVYRPLVTLDKKWNWICQLCTELPTLENGLAKIVEVDGKKKLQVVWEIKPKAKWGDGTPITAKDFILGWNIARSENVSTGDKEIYGRVEKIEVDPANPKKMIFHYKKARYDYYQMPQFYLMPAHLESAVWEKTKSMPNAYDKQSTYVTDSLNPGLYSGPYVVSEIKLGSHVMLKPNPHFYGNQPKIKKIVIKLISDTSTLEANLLSGTIDMIAELGLTFDQAVSVEKRFKQNPALGQKYRVEFKDSMTYEHIDFNLRNPVLKDLNVRRALTHGVDRQRLVNALFDGKQKVALHNINPHDVYFTDEVMKYPHDKAKAAELLDQAGWKKGEDGYRYKNGEKLSFTIMTTSQNKTRELVQVFLQSQWKKLGVDLKIKNEPARVFFGETVRRAKYQDMAMYAWISAPDNPPRSTLHSENIPTAENGWSGQNSGGWASDVADRMFDEIETEFDLNKRKELMKTYLKEYTNDVPVLPLYYRSDVAVEPANLVGHELTGHMFGPSTMIENWYFE